MGPLALQLLAIDVCGGVGHDRCRACGFVVGNLAITKRQQPHADAAQAAEVSLAIAHRVGEAPQHHPAAAAEMQLVAVLTQISRQRHSADITECEFSSGYFIAAVALECQAVEISTAACW